MAVDFKPEIKEYSNQGKFRYWVQMVLPTIYDDSLSYMELLNKVVHIINLAIEDVDKVEDNVTALLNSFSELQNYVNDYFDDLDVQEEINNKLDDMAASGELAEIIGSFLNDNIEVSNNIADNTAGTIKGTQDNAVIFDAENYYLRKNNLIAKYDEDFTILDELTLFGYQNDEEKYLVPYANGNQMLTNGNPLGAICCMATFIGKGITYGREHGMFNPYDTLYNQMVCSDYVQCGLRGITYNNSRAGGSSRNCESQYKSRTFKNNHSNLAPVEKNCLITRELAYIFASEGALFELDYDNYSNVNVGDILFFSSKTEAAGVKNFYLAVHHCAMVLNVDYENMFITVLESGVGASGLFRYSLTTNSAEAYDGVSVDIYRMNRASIVPDTSTVKILVAKPSYPGIEPKHIYNQYLTGSIESATTYRSILTFDVDQNIPWKQGDVGVLKYSSNFNTLNPNSDVNTTANVKVIGRVAGEATYKTLAWHWDTGTLHNISNDAIVNFVLDDVYDRILLQVNSSTTGRALTAEGVLDIYRA